MARGDTPKGARHKAELTDDDTRLARNIALVKRLRDLNNRDIATGLGRGNTDSDRNWVQERVSGKMPLTHGQVREWAVVLQVPVEVLVGEPQGIVDYLNSHPELVPGAVGCLNRRAGQVELAKTA